MLQRAKRLFKRPLNIGVSPDNELAVNQQILVANLFAMIGYSITFLMSLSAFIRSDTILALALLFASLMFFVSHCLNGFRERFSYPSHKISASIILTCLLILMGYLLHTGGHNNTGPLWVYIVPPVVFFFGGLKQGAIQLILFALFMACLLFLPESITHSTQYHPDFKSRFFYSFLTVALLFGFYEYSRYKSIVHIQQLSDQFEQQAMHDPLTQLPNRRGMTEFLNYEFDRAKRTGYKISVIICDIDFFKQINDEFGHDGGDAVLVQLAELFSTTIRTQDKIARWGGEEFLFLLPETDAKMAYNIAEKIRLTVESNSFKFDNEDISTTISMGVKEVDPSLSIDAAISAADQFLYRAKAMGRNRCIPSFKTNKLKLVDAN